MYTPSHAYSICADLDLIVAELEKSMKGLKGEEQLQDGDMD